MKVSAVFVVYKNYCRVRRHKMGALLSAPKGRESKSGPTSGVVNPQHALALHSDVVVDLNDPEVASAARDYQARVTPFTDDDAAWISSNQGAKKLDANVKIVGVGYRNPNTGHPVVLVTYPLRVAADRSRADKKGYSTHKWSSRKASQPVPWPNTFWLVCPDVATAVGTLEHAGLVRDFHNKFVVGHETYDPVSAAKFARQHARYAAYRWSLLTEEDRLYCVQEGYDAVLRDCGVGGLRFVNQVKCLHLQYGHYLASGGDNVAGEWTRAELDRGGERVVLGS